MNKTINLTIEDRYNIVKYAHQIPSSASVYFSFPSFIDKISLTDAEAEQYAVKVGEDGKIESNSPDKMFEFAPSDFPETVMSAISGYVDSLRTTMADLREANKDNPEYTDSELYTDIIKYLSKLM